MERFKIINKNKEKEYFSIKLHDTKENFDFWIDCSIIDGYGNKENGENIDEIQFFIDDKNDDLLRYFLESGEK